MIDTTAWLLGGGFAVTAVGLARQIRITRGLGKQLASKNEQLRDLAENKADLLLETHHLAHTRLPALMNAAALGHRGVIVPGLRQEDLRGTAFTDDHQAVLDLFEEAISAIRQRIGLAALSTVRDVITELQTFLVRCQLGVVDEMHRYPEGSAYHESLMRFDQLVTRALHILQRTRILAGSWPGLQRADCSLGEIIESARGRIDDLARVHYSYDPSTGGVWVVGRVVEPVTVALTELLSNATAFSDGKVAVEVQQIQTGYCIVVDDAGISMSASERKQASELLSQHAVLDVTTLRNTLRLGFPVIGRLCTEYGFYADVSTTSPFGGVRAVLRIPLELLGQGPTVEEQEVERRAALEQVVSHPLEPDGRSTPAGVSALPKRRRRQPTAGMAPSAAATEPAPVEDPDVFSHGFANWSAVIREGENTTPGGEPRNEY